MTERAPRETVLHPDEIDVMWSAMDDEERKVLLFGLIGDVEGLLEAIHGTGWRRLLDQALTMLVPVDKLPASVKRR